MGEIRGYIRVSTEKQNTENQRLAIYKYCEKEDLKVNDWISVEASTKRSSMARKIDKLMEKVEPGDMVIVAELSRLGRSVGRSLSWSAS